MLYRQFIFKNVKTVNVKPAVEGALLLEIQYCCNKLNVKKIAFSSVPDAFV